jgi:hypothetical protein
MVKIVLGSKAASKISVGPESAGTINYWTCDMSSNFEEEKINSQTKFSLQINESTDISGNTQLIANIQYINGDIITSNFFSAKNFHSKQLTVRYFVFLMNILWKWITRKVLYLNLQRCGITDDW